MFTLFVFSLKKILRKMRFIGAPSVLVCVTLAFSREVDSIRAPQKTERPVIIKLNNEDCIGIPSYM